MDVQNPLTPYLPVAYAVSAIIGGGFVALTTWLLTRRKQLHLERMDMVPTFEARIISLEKANEKCLTETVALHREIARLEAVVGTFRKEEDYKHYLDRMDNYLHNRTHDILTALSAISNRVAEGNIILGRLTGVKMLQPLPDPNEVAHGK